MLRNYSDLTALDIQSIKITIINNQYKNYTVLGKEINVEPRVISRIALETGFRKNKPSTRNIKKRTKTVYRKRKSVISQVVESKTDRLLKPLHLISVAKIKARREALGK